MRSGGTLAFLVLLLNPGAVSAEALRFETEAGTVRALRGETLVWENRHDRGGQLGDATASGGLVGPVQVGELVHYSIGGSAFRVDAATGAVRARVLLPGFCTALSEDGDGVGLSVVSASGTGTWTRSYRIGPDGHDVPFFLPAGFIAARLSRNDAENVLTGLLEADPEAPQRQPGDDSWRRRPELRPYLEAAIVELSALAERDPTNPWYHYWRGEYLEDLGQAEDAAAAFRSVMDLDPAYDFELLPMVLRLDEVSPKLGDAAFERAMRFLIGHGFEPESMFALTSVAIHYGFAGKPAPLDPATDMDRLVQLGQRLWDFAPLGEGAASMYAGLAAALDDAGRGSDAAIWRARSAEAMPSRVFGVPNPLASWAGPATNAFIASILAIFLAVFVKSLRYASAQRRASGMARWNPFCSWTRGEIVGLLAVFVLVLASWAVAYRSLASIGRAAAFPLDAVSGNLGHPESVEHLSQFQGTPGGDFVYALALQESGKLERAATIYERLETPRAKSNLGMIYTARGDQARARTLFQEARAAEPDLAEASHNLGEAASSARIERMTRYGLDGPFLALPTPEMWSDALAGRWGLGDLSDFFQPMSVISSAPAPEVARADLLDFNRLLVTALVLIGALAMIGLLVRAPQPLPGSETKMSTLGWALGFVVPGTARQLSLLGPPLLAVFAFSMLVWQFMAGSGGVSADMIEMVTLPAINDLHGISAVALSWQQHAARQTADLWWMLWIANLIVVLALERLWPDPMGPRQRTD